MTICVVMRVGYIVEIKSGIIELSELKITEGDNQKAYLLVPTLQQLPSIVNHKFTIVWNI